MFEINIQADRTGFGLDNGMVLNMWKAIKGSNDESLQHIDGLVQEKRNSKALAMELRLSCTNPSIYSL